MWPSSPAQHVSFSCLNAAIPRGTWRGSMSCLSTRRCSVNASLVREWDRSGAKDADASILFLRNAIETAQKRFVTRRVDGIEATQACDHHSPVIATRQCDPAGKRDHAASISAQNGALWAFRRGHRSGRQARYGEAALSKNIVILCDGTGNEIGETLSNVLKLYRMLPKDEGQRVYYSPGVGTIGYENAWQRFKQQARGVFGLATGYGLDADVLGAYRFLSETYQTGDKVWLFGFSRGAYTVRILAAFTHVVGLLRPDQLNIAGYAFAAYKRASAQSRRDDAGARKQDTPPPELKAAWDFGRVAGAAPIRIEFMGVWDTVASVIVPRRDALLPDLQTLRHTRTNPSVKTFRQTIAIDERRRMFRLNRWTPGQPFRADPFRASSEVPQDVREVWFIGVHADVGGGYPEAESGLSKYPLWWMVEEARTAGLRIEDGMFRHLVFGHTQPGGRHAYTPPDHQGHKHDSLTPAWRLLEWLPKNARWREWPADAPRSGWYLPRGEPRPIPEGALVHRSVFRRLEADPNYRPPNLSRTSVQEETRAFDLPNIVVADETEAPPARLCVADGPEEAR